MLSAMPLRYLPIHSFKLANPIQVRPFKFRAKRHDFVHSPPQNLICFLTHSQQHIHTVSNALQTQITFTVTVWNNFSLLFVACRGTTRDATRGQQLAEWVSTCGDPSAWIFELSYSSERVVIRVRDHAARR